MINFKNVSKVYANGVRALNSVSLSINPNEIVYLTGRSGSGKSTLLKLIYKAAEPTKGKIFVKNKDLSKIGDRHIYQLRRDVGVVFQDFKLLPNLTNYENVAYTLEVIGESEDKIKEKVMSSLALVGLEDKASHYPGECSGGEQQRVAIARAICKSPSILLADEPTGNLNPEIAEEIMRLFYRINKQGTTVVIATHNWELIKKYPHRVLQIHDGKIMSDRSKNHISILLSDDFNNLHAQK